MGTLYWSIVALLLGACIGSFLNVVIYRWPLGLSIREPARSFCPSCGYRLAWYDNIPLVSYLVLRARCRKCGVPISLQYPVVELATALVFLMTYDAFFVARLRIGIGSAPVDAVMLVAHWALFAGLIVLTVMDLEAYMVDIRVTWLVSLAGVVGHLLWTPAGSAGWIRPGAVQAGWALATAIGLGFGAWLMLRWNPDLPIEEDSLLGGHGTSQESPRSPAAGRTWKWAWLVLALGLVVAYLVAMQTAGVASPAPSEHGDLGWRVDPGYQEFTRPSFRWDSGAVRAALGVLALFAGLTAAASRPQTETDTQIIETIESEAPDARRMALSELKLLTPAILLGAAVLVLLTNVPSAREGWARVMEYRVWGDWRPVLGLSTGVAGWILGGAIGWLARIVFTLLFGKEALGMGDVHILAAAGAVAGWPVALLGFFLGAMLALAGLVVIRLRRRSRALPYGPWLGLGFFLAAMFQDRFLVYLNVRWLFE